VQIRFWGVRGSVPVPGAGTVGAGGNTPCVEVVAAPDDVIVLDAGTGIRALGIDLQRRVPAVNRIHVFLSHFHWDHLQGLPYFAPLFEAGRTIRFYTTHDPDTLQRILATQMAAPFYPFPLEAVSSQPEFCVLARKGVRIGETTNAVTVSPFPLQHPQGCAGFRLDAGGRVVIYATDFERGEPAFDAVLDAQCAGADVVIADAQYTDDEREAHRGWGHSTWRQAAELARQAKAGRLILFHHDPARTDGEVAAIERAAREVFPATDAARENLEVEV
jgi:phosphoribosyl 1,2-cyclic phosphodiesterase